MRQTQKGKQYLAVALSALLAVGGLPTMVFADGGQKSGEHTQECYTDDLICGYIVDEDNIASDSDATASDSNAEHTHTQECYALDCPHENGEHRVNGEPAKTITDWTFVGDDYLNEGELPLSGVSMEQQADFNIIVSMLPTGISAEIEGETEITQVDITRWNCPEYVQNADHNWPVTGDYVFTAELPEGYACDSLLTVKVLIGGAQLFVSPITGTGYSFAPDTGKLTVSSNEGTTAWRSDIGIGPDQWGWYSAVKTLEITNNVTAIGAEAFQFCNEIKSITIPDSVTSIGKWAFRDCTGLESVILADDITADIGEGAFMGCTNLKNITIPKGKISIRGEAFRDCTKLKSITIPGSVTSIGEWAFQGCTGLESVILADDIKADIGESAFMGCINLKSITIPKGVTAIGENAFRDCTGLESVILADDIKADIGPGAFISCTNLKSITIPEGVKDIGQDAFWSCTGLTSVIVNNSKAPFLGSSAFDGTPTDLIIFVPAGATGYDEGNWSAEKVVKGAALAGLTIGGATLKPDFSPKVTSYTVSVPNTVEQVTVTPMANGTSTITVNEKEVASGSDSDNITLTAGGDTTITVIVKNSETDSRTYTVTVSREKISPTLTLEVSPPNSQTFPDDVILTATLTGTSGGNAGKTIQFTGNGTVTATTNESGVATHTFTDLTPGTYNFGASFAGDDENTQVTAVSINGYTVSRGTQNALTLNGLASAYTYGDSAFALSTSGGSGNGAVSYTSSNGAVASVADNQVTIHKAGTFTITATKAADDKYSEAQVTSNTVTVHSATPGVSLTATGGADINNPIVLTATVSKVGTGATPAGNVIFCEGGTTLGTVALDGSGRATCTVSNPAAGNHTYTAAYSGQTDYYSANSATRDVGVGLADQTGFAVSDPGAKTYGDGDFTLAAAGGQSSGAVSYSVPDGNGVLTVAADGRAVIIGAGKVRVTATKAGDSAYNQATATQEITVAPRDIANVTVNITGSRVYTGSQLQPLFAVNDSGIAINTGDYINKYGHNVDAGANAGSITLTGQRNYTGSKVVTFDIEKRPLTGAAITLESASFPYTGREIRPAVTGVEVDGIVVPPTAFEVTYTNNTSVGKAAVTITAKADGNFTGTASAEFKITRRRESSSSDDSDSSYTNPDILRGSWIQTEAGVWMFRQTSGAYAKNRWGMVDGLWYFFDGEGKMLTGWQFLGGQWYYLYTKEDAAAKVGIKEGAMAVGWYFDPQYQKWFYFDTSGAMVTGWREIDGKWHYFNLASDGTKGAMVTDSVIDGRYIDKSGVWYGKA